MLKSITVDNFRSIKGSTTFPLDAPVVLIHGHNGSGKTSLLSAIELGLTGQIPSLRRLDSDYVSHLVHKASAEARVIVSTDAFGSELPQTAQIIVKRAEILGSPLLTTSQAHFYSERCYLAQATLGRLLEIYEDRDARKSDSPLTKFVKDLLGLDQLDALIDGLHDAGDIRRFRTALPIYWDAHERLPALNNQLAREKSELADLHEQLRQIQLRLQDKLTKLNIDAPLPLAAPIRLQLGEDPEERELQQLATVRRNIIAAQEQWKTIQSPVTAGERDKAEDIMTAANNSLRAWQESTGREFELLFERLKPYFTSLPSPLSAGPEKPRIAALQLVTAELERCRTLLNKDQADTTRLGLLDQDIERARARSVVLDQQVALHASNASAMAQALAGIMPHIHSEECPVCGRDFSEQSSQPLKAHVSARISLLTESAGRLQALTHERAEASKVLSIADRERGVVAGRLLTAAARDELKGRTAQLEDFSRALVNLASASTAGEQVIKTAAAATRTLNELRARDQRGTSFRETAARFADELHLAAVEPGEGFETALFRFQTVVTEREEKFSAQLQTRRELISDLRQYDALLASHSRMFDVIRQREAELNHLIDVKGIADERIAEAKRLANQAREVRTNVVRRVFNDSLNSLWRDLFVRLAPDEPFLPAFKLPERQTGPVEAVLETVYKAGSRGGNPRAMLSAGNLNTAALTLFLALHLSVKPALPCLVIDDPVQSMDEVHIAQSRAWTRYT